MGMKPKYSKEMVAKICKYVGKGLTNQKAANVVGISETTFYEWIKTKPELVESLKRARDEGEAANLEIILKARDKNWTAAAWLLERKHPEEYALRQKLEHSGKIDSTVRNNVLDTMTIEQMEKLEAKIDKIIRGSKS